MGILSSIFGPKKPRIEIEAERADKHFDRLDDDQQAGILNHMEELDTILADSDTTDNKDKAATLKWLCKYTYLLGDLGFKEPYKAAEIHDKIEKILDYDNKKNTGDLHFIPLMVLNNHLIGKQPGVSSLYTIDDLKGLAKAFNFSECLPVTHDDSNTPAAVPA